MSKEGNYRRIADFGGQIVNTKYGAKVESDVKDGSDFGYCISGGDLSLFPDMDVINNKDSCRELVADYASKKGWDNNVELYYSTHTDEKDRVLFKSSLALRQNKVVPKVGMDVYSVNPMKPNSVIVARPETITDFPSVDLGGLAKVRQERTTYMMKQ